MMNEKTVKDGKSIDESRVTMGLLMGPEHANVLGSVHGGVIMKLADEAGALAAMRHARSPVVTIAIDSLTFLEPIVVGNFVSFHAHLTYAGRTSMEACVKVIAEDPITGEKTKTNMAYMVYVAIDDQKKPRPVPQLVPSTEEESHQMMLAAKRQQMRKERQASSEGM